MKVATKCKWWVGHCWHNQNHTTEEIKHGRFGSTWLQHYKEECCRCGHVGRVSEDETRDKAGLYGVYE